MKRTILIGFLFLLSIVAFQSIAGDFKYTTEGNTLFIEPTFLKQNSQNKKYISVDIIKQNSEFIAFLNSLYKRVLSPEQLKELKNMRYTLVFHLNTYTGNIYYCRFSCHKKGRHLISEKQLREITDALLKARFNTDCLSFPNDVDKKSKMLGYTIILFPVQQLNVY